MSFQLPNPNDVAMRDLGVRRGLDETVTPIILAYSSGRLVDREAIDRQAAIVAVAEGISDYISAADDWSEWETEATALVSLALAAAIGDTDE